VSKRNEFLRILSEFGLDDCILSPGDLIRSINGDEENAEMKNHLHRGTMLHLLVNRPQAPVRAEPKRPPCRLWLSSPPMATPLRKTPIPPPPKASLTGPGSWPCRAPDICRLFADDAEVTIDLHHAYMTRETRNCPRRRVWFGLGIRRLMVHGKPLIADAHVSLLSGEGTVIDQEDKIARVFHKEFADWKKGWPDGMPTVLRHPTDLGVDTFQSKKPDYAWLNVIPSKGLYELLFQAVARAKKAHVGPREDIYARINFHVSFDTSSNAPCDASHSRPVGRR
jgi:hypothetical protein